ncbi:G [Spodoptera frugiperda rhabdovirus]|uniref:G n=1 Tax=Spodoptera frugiperda rhabdovirus TaxID=1481139 RepID=X2KZ75_9RHAB|nr:G [Spodoptera frugiperda rhabdovirus] [Spodoptera frugiperda rhabdovirus]AHN92646.1 G [Spodoptera frugiperda rhabdovirus] [Spodoptera frugiperda rhabdovirus]QAS68967.1 G [Spodoptera frugiperda rhabdovirus] [Spodoptera frugiperda rhabdovirus]WKD80966.1 G [Spodoptera frugiperda rhabdovirus] [Spodoptera frugiperda rhabdovirus]WPA94109.1 putative glycoprotein [Spodoptera frugiperda rhabdovirus]
MVFLSLSTIIFILSLRAVTCSNPLSYPNGILTNNSTHNHPLSDFYIFYENSSLTYTQFPVAPDCSSILDTRDEQYPTTVTLWKVDQESQAEWGLLLWQERIDTTCSWNFWGNYKGSIVSKSSVPLKDIPSGSARNGYWALSNDEVQEIDHVPYNLRYYCYWCRNEYPGSFYMRYVKKVRIIRNPDGSIKTPRGSWVHELDNLWGDQMRYLVIRRFGGESSCPLKIYDVRAGVLSKSRSNFILVSLPSLNLQFSVSLESTETKCSFGDKTYDIVQSMGGYLLSIDIGNANWRGPWDPTPQHPGRERRSIMEFPDQTSFRYNQFINYHSSPRHKRHDQEFEFPLSLKSSYDYAQFRYEQNFIIRQINKNFGLLQKSICDIQFSKWQNLSPPNLAMKIAHYVTGSIHSIGGVHHGSYSIQRTEKSITKVNLVFPIVIVHGMYKCQREPSKEVVWAEPVTGILFKSPIPTHFSLSSSWLPGVNGSSIVPLTGQILLPEITMDHLEVVQQVEAKMVKSMYTNVELFGSTEEFQRYQTQGITSDEQSNTVNPWIGLLIHGGVSIATGILVALLIPSILKLFRHIIEKGEASLEERLHLRETSRKEFVKVRGKPWGV